MRDLNSEVTSVKKKLSSILLSFDSIYVDDENDSYILSFTKTSWKSEAKPNYCYMTTKTKYPPKDGPAFEEGMQTYKIDKNTCL